MGIVPQLANLYCPTHPLLCTQDCFHNELKLDNSCTDFVNIALDAAKLVFLQYHSRSILLHIATSTSTPPKLKGPFFKSSDRSPRIEIHVTRKQPVNEFHPTVQELVEAGYSMEQSIEAVEHHEDVEGAMDYLLRLEGEEGIFKVPASDEGHQYQEENGMKVVEESQEERAG